MYKETYLLDYKAWLEIDDEGGISASYMDAETLLDELTYVIREAESVDGVRIPEETDIDYEQWSAYQERLLDWVSAETGISREVLANAWHPDVAEPFVRYKP